MRGTRLIKAVRVNTHKQILPHIMQISYMERSMTVNSQYTVQDHYTYGMIWSDSYVCAEWKLGYAFEHRHNSHPNRAGESQWAMRFWNDKIYGDEFCNEANLNYYHSARAVNFLRLFLCRILIIMAWCTNIVKSHDKQRTLATNLTLIRCLNELLYRYCGSREWQERGGGNKDSLYFWELCW